MYPKGIAFYMWLAKHGWDEAEALKREAGERGSRVHQATEDIDAGKEVKMSDKYTNPNTLEESELGLVEWEALMSYRDWLEEVKPTILANEQVVFGEDYAGTLDRILEIDGKVWLVDIKTSQKIWTSHELQVSAYLHALPEKVHVDGLAILQIGYRKNKKLWKFTEIEDKYELFRHARAIWENEVANKEPLQRDYPLSLKVVVKKSKKLNESLWHGKK